MTSELPTPSKHPRKTTRRSCGLPSCVLQTELENTQAGITLHQVLRSCQAPLRDALLDVALEAARVDAALVSDGGFEMREYVLHVGVV